MVSDYTLKPHPAVAECSKCGTPIQQRYSPHCHVCGAAKDFNDLEDAHLCALAEEFVRKVQAMKPAPSKNRYSIN